MSVDYSDTGKKSGETRAEGDEVESERAARVAAEKSFRAEQQARADAEAARRRWAFIAEASSILGSTLDYDLTLERVAHLAVPEIADWCAVDLADEYLQPGERVAVAHIDPEMVERARESYRKFPPDPEAEQGLAGVLRSGKSQIYPDISDEVLVASARSPEHLAYLREVGLKSAMIVPMIARGRTLGAVTFVSSRDETHYDEDDLRMAEELARHAAMSVDNARLFRETQQAWHSVSIRATQQQAVAQLAHRALEVDCETLFKEALARLVALMKADAAKLVEFSTRNSSLVLRAAVGWDERFIGRELASADDDTSIGYALRRNEVVIVGDLDASEFRAPEDLVEEGVCSSISVQVPGTKRPFGVLSVLSRETCCFSEDDANLVRGVSNVLSAAVEKERAEQQREHMYGRLTDAIRSHEELLSIVSHDLRSPAAAVKLNLEIVGMQIDGKLDDPEPVVVSLKKAGDNIDRMVALMDDLLSSFRSDSEEMSLSVEQIDFAEVVRSVISGHERDLLETHTELELDIEEPLIGECDRMRLQQVVSNLLSNAIKYGGGTPVTLSLHQDEEWVEFTVRDGGEGIPQEKQEEIFQRFRRADDRERGDSYGLGLWIVKRIVDALRGSITVDSTPGEGTTFCVRLPRIADV